MSPKGWSWICERKSRQSRRDGYNRTLRVAPPLLPRVRVLRPTSVPNHLRFGCPFYSRKFCSAQHSFSVRRFLQVCYGSPCLHLSKFGRFSVPRVSTRFGDLLLTTVFLYVLFNRFFTIGSPSPSQAIHPGSLDRGSPLFEVEHDTAVAHEGGTDSDVPIQVHDVHI